ncbi:hypothetical protein [Streptomyces sp. W1SF4]|uniref:hypothetical protein n=1 Tax=Streptomyces sp. W1SF4 TaxID=2305220 RepID=UPI000F71F487|nr:hypothetical protein [Streptomyces sp. W1SF4]AZM91770.1 hypothetical protein D1J60_27520 [Streptomyces sp. W1SF4]
MDLQFVGMDPNTGEEGSPTVWVEEETADLVLQGVTAEEVLRTHIHEIQWVPGHAPGIPAHETVIRIPARMVPILREACNAAERAQLRGAAGADADVSSPPGDA